MAVEEAEVPVGAQSGDGVREQEVGVGGSAAGLEKRDHVRSELGAPSEPTGFADPSVGGEGEGGGAGEEEGEGLESGGFGGGGDEFADDAVGGGGVGDGGEGGEEAVGVLSTAAAAAPARERTMASCCNGRGLEG